MDRLRIYIDPEIKQNYAQEVCWVWRLLFTGMGYSWEEVTEDRKKCDIAYVCSMDKGIESQFAVRADMNRWNHRSKWRLDKLGSFEDLVYPIYNEEDWRGKVLKRIKNTLVCERDIIFDVFWLATGQEEKHMIKDRYGFLDLSETPALKEKMPLRAVASDIGLWLEKKLSEVSSVQPIPRWPHAKKAAICISHDVDYPEVHRLEPFRLLMENGFGGWRSFINYIFGKKSYWNFEAWSNLEESWKVKSAFYFAARKGSLIKYLSGTPDPFYDVRTEKFRLLFDYLIRRGSEIGLHASYYAFQDEDRFLNEKRVLKEASGCEVVGNRHHYWHLNPEDGESTLLLHERIGLKYDTSLAHEKYMGWRRGLSWPYFPFHQKERRELKTLQIATAWMDDQLFKYVEYNGPATQSLQTLVNTVQNQKGCLLIDYHDYVFSESIFPGWLSLYKYFFNNLLRGSEFWFSLPLEVAEYWIARYQSIANRSIGLEQGR